MDTAGTKMELKGFLRVIQKLFSLSLPSGITILFKKCAVFLLDTCRKAGNCVLLHYIGYDNLAIDCPHGNFKKKYQQYFGTCPSVETGLHFQLAR